jgi:hypothetical protein
MRNLIYVTTDYQYQYTEVIIYNHVERILNLNRDILTPVIHIKYIGIALVMYMGKMNNSLRDVLTGMTDMKTATVLMNVLPSHTIAIADALLKRGVVTGWFRDYAFFTVSPQEFIDAMDSMNNRMNLVPANQ